MATQIRTLPTQATTAQRAVQADGIFCMIAGAVSTVGSGPISTMIGLNSSTPILILGLILLAYGGELFWLAMTNRLTQGILKGIIALDVIWVVASLLLLVADPFTFTDAGKWLVFIASDIVLAFGIWQFIGLRRMH